MRTGAEVTGSRFNFLLLSLSITFNKGNPQSVAQPQRVRKTSLLLFSPKSSKTLREQNGQALFFLPTPEIRTWTTIATDSIDSSTRRRGDSACPTVSAEHRSTTTTGVVRWKSVRKHHRETIGRWNRARLEAEEGEGSSDSSSSSSSSLRFSDGREFDEIADEVIQDIREEERERISEGTQESKEPVVLISDEKEQSHEGPLQENYEVPVAEEGKRELDNWKTHMENTINQLRRENAALNERVNLQEKHPSTDEDVGEDIQQ